MPKVSQAHLDARRHQILDAARTLFATKGFAGTSTADLVEASGMSNGAIYRYFKSKNELITAICDETTSSLPEELSERSLRSFLGAIRSAAREQDHARLIAQIYAEAAISAPLASIVQRQLSELRAALVALLPGREPTEAEAVADAFVALCQGYTQQLAVWGDVDPAPYVAALVRLTQE